MNCYVNDISPPNRDADVFMKQSYTVLQHPGRYDNAQSFTAPLMKQRDSIEKLNWKSYLLEVNGTKRSLEWLIGLLDKEL